MRCDELIDYMDAYDYKVAEDVYALGRLISGLPENVRYKAWSIGKINYPALVKLSVLTDHTLVSNGLGWHCNVEHISLTGCEDVKIRYPSALPSVARQYKATSSAGMQYQAVLCDLSVEPTHAVINAWIKGVADILPNDKVDFTALLNSQKAWYYKEREQRPVHLGEPLYAVFNVTEGGSRICQKIASIRDLTAMHELIGSIHEPVRNVIGTLEVRDVFSTPTLGTIAGCMVLDGVAKRHHSIRVKRANTVIYEGSLKRLRRYAGDVDVVNSGLECGVQINNYNDIQVGDLIEVYGNSK